MSRIPFVVINEVPDQQPEHLTLSVLDLVTFQSSQGKVWKDADEVGRLVAGLRGLDLIVPWGLPWSPEDV
jgi:hypothetical protein